MNIGMFTNTYLPHVGGVARSVEFFAEDLTALGHRVLVVAPEYGEEEPPADHPVLRVPAIQHFNGSDFSMRIPLPFYIDQAISKFAPDVVHSHHPFLLGDAAVRVARKRSLPLVFTHHTRYEQYTHYVPLDSDVLQNFVIHLATMYANLCSRVIAPSRSIAGLLKSRGVVRPVEEIPTGVDIGFFGQGDGQSFRREVGLPPEALVIGHLGRLAPEKNLAFLSAAVALALEKSPHAHFLVIGKGPSEAEIRRILTRKGVAQKLRLAGEATGDRLRDAYHAMDLFVFSSTSETQGMVLVEAMAAGKPAIALDAPGSREVVRDGANGRLLPENASVEEFAAAIGGFSRRSGLAERWIAGARETAKDFSREVCARKMEAVYRQALEEHALGGGVEPAAPGGPLDALAERIKTEWELWRRKTVAAVDAVQSALE